MIISSFGVEPLAVQKSRSKLLDSRVKFSEQAKIVVWKQAQVKREAS